MFNFVDKILIGIAIVLSIALGVEYIRVKDAHAAAAKAQVELAQSKTDLADLKTKYAQEAADAQDAARQEESRREAAKQEVIDEANKQTAAAKAAADLADAAAVGLRKQLAAYVAASRRSAGNPPTAAGGKGQPGQDPLDLLAKLYGGSDQAAGDIAKYADDLAVRAAACEQLSDAIQPRKQAAAAVSP